MEDLKLEEDEVPDCKAATPLASYAEAVLANKTTPDTIINILLVGPTGVGKSTLINTIFGLEVAEVGHTGSPCDHDDPVTTHRLPIVHMPDGKKTQIIIHDTIGFQEKEKKELFFKYIKKNVPKVHLLLVCHKLYDRVDASTVKFLKVLTEYCTKNVLNNMMFLLTHADAFVMRPPYKKSEGEEAIKKEFEDRLINMKELLCKRITELFPRIDTEEIAFCPTCDDITLALPHTDNWEYSMWTAILKRCDGEAKVVLSHFARFFRKLILYTQNI